MTFIGHRRISESKIEVDIAPGTPLIQAANEITRISRRLGMIVTSKHNEISLTARPYDDASYVLEGYNFEKRVSESRSIGGNRTNQNHGHKFG